MPANSIRLFDEAETSERLPFPQLIDALADGFSKGCVSPIRHHHHIKKARQPEATLLLMPAWSNSDEPQQYLGVKLVTVFPGNAEKGIPGLTSTYILYDGDTGRQIAMMDGNTITARRTVATSALAAKYLARSNAKTLLVIGAGRVASLIPDAYLAVRNIESIIIWDVNPAMAASFVERLTKRGLKASVATDLETAVKTADIISAATLATDPIIRGAWVHPGTHIDLIGGFTPKMRETDDEAVRRSSIFVDTPEAMIEAGDLVQPLANGTIADSAIRGTLAQLTSGAIRGRQNDEEITYFKAVGSALADLTSAKLVFGRHH